MRLQWDDDFAAPFRLRVFNLHQTKLIARNARHYQ